MKLSEPIFPSIYLFDLLEFSSLKQFRDGCHNEVQEVEEEKDAEEYDRACSCFPLDDSLELVRIDEEQHDV